jgi:hypothetical protein
LHSSNCLHYLTLVYDCGGGGGGGGGGIWLMLDLQARVWSDLIELFHYEHQQQHQHRRHS